MNNNFNNKWFFEKNIIALFFMALILNLMVQVSLLEPVTNPTLFSTLNYFSMKITEYATVFIAQGCLLIVLPSALFKFIKSLYGDIIEIEDIKDIWDNRPKSN